LMWMMEKRKSKENIPYWFWISKQLTGEDFAAPPFSTTPYMWLSIPTIWSNRNTENYHCFVFAIAIETWMKMTPTLGDFKHTFAYSISSIQRNTRGIQSICLPIRNLEMSESMLAYCN
jgi:hypothetical protein